MPDLSVARQEALARQQMDKYAGFGVKEQPLDFQHDKQKMTLANSFFQAVISGSVNKVRGLLKRGANIHARNDYGLSPLVAALHVEDEQRRRRMFRLLLDQGSSHKVKDEKNQRSVLLWACLLGQCDQVKTLLEETAGDINLQDKDKEGFTALHHAVRIGSLPIVEKLVEYHSRFGVSVDTADNLGLTPYLHARRLGYRDVANVLRNQGLASIGHGDSLFRSPREWSQIGKFERKKAIELQAQDQINAAKVLGKINLARYMENSPRMAVPGIVVPSFRPDVDVHRQGKKPSRHISVSLPALGEAESDLPVERPSSTGQNTTDNANPEQSNHPGPPTQAFVHAENQSTDSKVSTKGSGSQYRFSTHDKNVHSNMPLHIPGQTSSHSSLTNAGPGARLPRDSNAVGNAGPTHFGGQRPIMAPPMTSGSNPAALSLLEHSSFSRGRVANQFRQSEFDTNKSSEYKHMLGNITSIMDMLSQQQTKSFRKSVEVKKPETPPKAKKKAKVSTFAILFGGSKSARRKKSKSPHGSSARKKGGKSPSVKSDDKKQKSKSSNNDKSEKPATKSNKLSVPTIKIN